MDPDNLGGADPELELYQLQPWTTGLCDWWVEFSDGMPGFCTMQPHLGSPCCSHKDLLGFLFGLFCPSVQVSNGSRLAVCSFCSMAADHCVLSAWLHGIRTGMGHLEIPCTLPLSHVHFFIALQYGYSVARTRGGGFCCACFLMSCCCCCQCFFAGAHRGDIRRKYQLEEKPLHDCLLHLLCGPFAICQEAREHSLQADKKAAAALFVS